MDELISIVLPTYNRKDDVTRAIDSVLAQTYSNFELIVIDDGSNDGTEQALRTYKESIVYYYQENQGVAKARNFGCRKASGNWIAFIDSDDCWKPEKLAKQMAFIDKYPSIGLCYTDAYRHFPDGSIKGKPERVKKHASICQDFKSVIRDPYFGMPTVMVKKELLKKIDWFDESLKTAEDLDMYLKIASYAMVGYVHEKLVDIYIKDQSLGSSMQSYEDNLLVLERLVKDQPIVSREIQKVIRQSKHDIYIEYAKSLLWEGQSHTARRKLHQAARYKLSLVLCVLFLKSFVK
ncbi:MAG: glycosyltransferase family 2 protein [Flavobacteriaceae bacterium]|nr:glycosyltransferase family 2 protein [Flavobacteriaceae bacterium]